VKLTWSYVSAGYWAVFFFRQAVRKENKIVMRSILLLLFIIMVIGGCRKDNNSVESSTQPILSVSRIIDSSKYTLTIPHSVFGVSDTLEGTLTELNLKGVPETLYVNTANMEWTLKNDGGEIILHGPQFISNMATQEIIAPNQSTVVGLLAETYTHLPKGSYVLNVGGSLDLSLSLFIQ
jgi:hypothetical protein